MDAGDIPRGPAVCPHPSPSVGVIVALVTAVGTTVQFTGTVKVVAFVTVTTKVVALIAGLKVPPVTPAIVTESPVVRAFARVVVTVQGLPKEMLATMVLAVVPKSTTASVRDIAGVPAKIVV